MEEQLELSVVSLIDLDYNSGGCPRGGGVPGEAGQDPAGKIGEL